MKLFLLLLRQSPGLMGLAILIGALSGAAATGLIAVVHRALGQLGALPEGLAWTFLGLCAAYFLTDVLAQYLLLRLAQNIALDLRIRLSRQILASALRHLEEVGAARLLAVLTGDVSTVVQALLQIPGMMINITIVVGCLAYLGWLSWHALVAFVLFMALGLGVYRLGLGQGYRFHHLNRRQQDELFQGFQAVTDGVKELKLHRRRRDHFLTQRFDPIAQSLRRSAIRAETIFSLSAGWGHLLLVLFIGILLFVLPQWASIEPEILTGVALVTLFLAGPFEGVVAAIPQFSRATVSLKKIESMKLAFSEQPEESGAPATAPSWQRLELAGVTHTYYHEGEERDFTLGPIDLTVGRGEMIFVAGGNGSGKTTLAKLLTGLYIPEDGELRLDGLHVTTENRETFRQLFSAVFWDFYPFRQFLGLDEALVERDAQGYLEKLELSHKVEIHDGTLSTTDLSQGQKKRLALLTAYLEDRSIYLFDEWAADQDPEFKEIFYRDLLPELKARGKTVFIISHDNRYYDVADRILLLEDGQVRSFEKIVEPSPTNAPGFA